MPSHPPGSHRTNSAAPAAGGPLPLGPVLLELRNGRRWAVGISALIQMLVLSLMFLVPLLVIERPVAAPTPTPYVVFEPLRGEPHGKTHVPPAGGGEKNPHHLLFSPLTVTILAPVNTTPSSSPQVSVAEFGQGPGTGEPNYGDPNGSRDGFPLLSGPMLPTAAPPTPRAPVPVGGRVRAPRRLHRVEPVYPRFAQQAGIQGVVVFDAVLGADGRVQHLTSQSGHPALVSAAREAVEQWVYEPTYLNEQPVPVRMTITVEFRLRK